MFRSIILAVCLCLVNMEANAAGLDGQSMNPMWGLPFIGILFSISLGPLLFSRIWHRYYGLIGAGWSLAVLIPMMILQGADVTLPLLFHTLALEYLPFILMLFALFTAAGGIVIQGNLHGSPVTNTALLTIGSLLASVIGTTAAAMILIRPLIRANDNRAHNAHVIIFFIFLVGNIGGALSPLGDPPLFLGFLRGVDFFWPVQHLWQQTFLSIGVLLVMFFGLDLFHYRREGIKPLDPTPDDPLRLSGSLNLLLIAIAICAIVMSGVWKPDINVHIFGTRLELPALLRDGAMVLVGIASLHFTDKSLRRSNGFEWEPIIEVAKLFAAIFVCIIPVMAMLQAGSHGPFAPLVSLVTKTDGGHDVLGYFWLTGLLSSFLDNAPTYLVFFEMAGGSPLELMTKSAPTLAAISLGAVFMGANTYIGNAPNFMIYAIARRADVGMPSFFAYMVWSALILLPLFALISFVFLA